MILSEHKQEFLAGVREDFKQDFSWAYDCILQDAIKETNGQVDTELLELYLNSRLTGLLNTKTRRRYDN